MSTETSFDQVSTRKILTHHKYCLNFSNSNLFRKETVLKILLSDGQKPKIEIFGMENGYLDIGYCAGACRHSTSVSINLIQINDLKLFIWNLCCFQIPDQQSVCLPSITTPLEIATNGEVHALESFTIVKTCLCSYVSAC